MSLRLLLVVVLLVACKEKNSEYCNGHPEDVANCPLLDGGRCTTDNQCGNGVCDTASSTCVQCTPEKAAACTGATPVCVDNACNRCTAHAQCAGSNVCLPDGSCAVETDVAYVDAAGTDNTMCAKAMPCTRLTSALTTTRRYIKLRGTIDDQVSINNQDVTLLAEPGAKLTSTTNGLLLEVRGSSHVSIYDLEISGASGSVGYGISMPTGNTAVLVLRRVKVLGNAAGGISISAGDFDIANTIVATNGNGSSLMGGIKIDGIAGGGTHRLEFSTITANVGPGTVNTGISCGTVLTPLTFANNIIYGNIVSSGGKQIGGSANCIVAHSDVGPDAATGTGVINVDPLFVGAATGNFHLMPTSPAKDVADPASTLDTDIDGDARPQGPARDMGADEVK